MENRKQYIERQLIGNVIKDKCAHNDDILFEESWCTQERYIRFTLPIFRALFPPKQNGGDWDSGDFVMFEVTNQDAFEIICMFSSKSFPTCSSRIRDEIPLYAGSESGKCFPISPRAAAPSRLSDTACSSTSASE